MFTGWNIGCDFLILLGIYPLYWIYQWTVEGEPFSLWQRQG